MYIIEKYKNLYNITYFNKKQKEFHLILTYKTYASKIIKEFNRICREQ
jgi:hypothetical protein